MLTPSAEEHKTKGNRLAKSKQYKAALTQYQLATEIDPTFSAAWLNQGLMHKQLKQLNAAITAFESAIKLKPNYYKAIFHLAECQFQQHEYKAAWFNYYKLQKKALQNALPTSFLKQIEIGLLKCEQKVAARIIFANVDLKFTDDKQVKILEFGSGMQSGFVGHRLLTGGSIRQLFIKELKKMSLPLYINSRTGIQDSNTQVDEKVRDFKLGDAQLFPDKLKSYQAIYGGLNLIPTPPEILKINDPVINTIFEDKCLLHRCFELSKQLNARPQTLILPRTYKPNLNIIRAKFPNASKFVLKAPDMEGGQGVLIVTAEELSPTLRLLLCENEPKKLQRESKNFTQQLIRIHKNSQPDIKNIIQKVEAIEKLSNSEHPEFMIEEYIPSKAYQKDHKDYDGTVRAAFMLVFDQESFQFTPLAAYWKLPPQPINQGTLRERTVSSFSKKHQSSARLDPIDQDLIYHQLSTILPQLFSHMLTFDMEAWVTQLKEDNFTQKSQKATRWLHYANTLLTMGYHKAAGYYLSLAKTLIPNHFKYLHQQGVHLHVQRYFDAAIKAFDQALEINPCNSASFYRRGLSWLAKNDIKKAQENFKNAVKLNPKYEGLIQYKLEKHINTHPQTRHKTSPNKKSSDQQRQMILNTMKSVQADILTSHNIVNRIAYPFYFNQSNVPELLVTFKKRLSTYRDLSSTLIAEHKQLSFPKEVEDQLKNLSHGTFAHNFIGSLVMSEFGIGDCSECAFQTAYRLIHQNQTSIAFVAIKLTNNQEGMESTHQFIVANLKQLPGSLTVPSPLYRFIEMLPEDAIIVDTFLEISFPPHHIHPVFNDYLNAYGGEAEVFQCIHLYNFTVASLMKYKKLVDIVVSEIKSRSPIFEGDEYKIFEKILVPETILITHLKAKTQLPFVGYRDSQYKVDAVVTLKKDNDIEKVKQLQRGLKGYGQFFTLNNPEIGKTRFVLEGINLPEGDPPIGQRIQNLIKKF